MYSRFLMTKKDFQYSFKNHIPRRRARTIINNLEQLIVYSKNDSKLLIDHKNYSEYKGLKHKYWRIQLTIIKNNQKSITTKLAKNL